MKKHIPNIITCCNLICGCIATYCAFYQSYTVAFLFILLGAFFDFFDGMTARALGVSDSLGLQLDSLADCVTFGVAPSAMLFALFNHVAYPSLMANEVWFTVMPFTAFIMAAFSALRLAKFNLDTRQSDSFIGLPTPANALFWIGLTFVCRLESVHSWLCFLNNEVFGCIWLAVILCSCFLLISEIPMFSLKLKKGHNGFAENKARYIFLAITAIILVAGICMGLGYLAATPALIILLYILLSITIKK